MPDDRGKDRMDRGNSWSKAIFYAVLLFMLAALAVYAYLGTFTRYMADDYCSAAALQNEGFWGAQAYWWENWSGRYSFSFVVSFVELFGLTVVPVLPVLIMSLWLFSMVWGVLPVLRGLKITNRVPGILFIASLALWLTYRSVDDYPQVVFWQTGILTYPITPILFSIGFGAAIRRSFHPAGVNGLELLLWFLFAWVAGGFSETGVVTQISLLTVLLIYVRVMKNERGRIFIPILIAALCGSVLSLVFIAAAPGNAVRSGGFQNIPPVAPSFLGSMYETLMFVPNWIERHTIVSVLGFLAGAFFASFSMRGEIQVSRSSIVRHLSASLLFVVAGIWAGIAPAYLLRGGMPPQRVFLFAYFLVACLVIYWGALSAMLLRSRLSPLARAFQGWITAGLLVLFLAVGVIPFMSSQIQLIPSLQVYATLWDERHRTLLSASQAGEVVIVTTDITKVESLRELGSRLWLSGDLETGPDHWVNRCAAQYYGVDRIVAE